jgi:hypothetical protein
MRVGYLGFDQTFTSGGLTRREPPFAMGILRFGASRE